MNHNELKLELEKILGPNGETFNLKQRYSPYKNHVLIHRANLCIEGYGKIWSGDLDFTSDENLIRKICRKFDVNFYILKEQDGRFVNSQNLPIEKAIIKITPTKTFWHEELSSLCKRDEKGKWKLKTDLSFLFPKD